MSGQETSAVRWRTSSHSSGQGTECVQVASVTQRVVARDSKDSAGPVLAFSLTAWAAFLGDVKRGLYGA
ncbi:DUF397 domain-containing protein [Actinomadura montaniterrae]|uniref:DUF397 domain-containing protein n=1 Tax=Actinomadura montaniterrae TaxID=1803903 RepID=A0A6L3VJY0_9ACTN|nr:DUF397 domain-containing protein [Actinomadura montaniterrae]KAB2371387.1 DUF397 domain-containing protein [Actinomadura montaniterrae]